MRLTSLFQAPSSAAADLVSFANECMSGYDRTGTEARDQLPAFPKLPWVMLFLGVWLLFGITPSILVYIGTNYFSVADSELAAVAGTIGDAFSQTPSSLGQPSFLSFGAFVCSSKKFDLLARSGAEGKDNEYQRRTRR
jgi:hypothetical protein